MRKVTGLQNWSHAAASKKVQKMLKIYTKKFPLQAIWILGRKDKLSK
jgi:hypothetical protein